MFVVPLGTINKAFLILTLTFSINYYTKYIYTFIIKTFNNNYNHIRIFFYVYYIMVYKKRKSKYTRAQKAYYHTHNVADIAGKALKVAYYTKRLLNVERKVLDVQQNAVPITSSGVFLETLNCGRGTSNVQRDGAQIKLASLLLKYYISMNASATDTTVRCMLVLDKQCNAALPTLSDILHTTTISQNIVSPLSLKNKFRFRILYNKVHQTSINGKRNVFKKMYKKLNIKIRYEGNSDTISDISSYNIYFICMSDEATNTPLIETFIRTRFIDN